MLKYIQAASFFLINGISAEDPYGEWQLIGTTTDQAYFVIDEGIIP